MDILVWVLLLAALVAIIWGVVSLFRKGRRKRGILFIVGSFACFIFAAMMAGNSLDRTARDAGFADRAAQIAAEDAEQERRFAELNAQREREQQEERDRLDAKAREHGYESHAAQQEAERLAEQLAAQAQRERLAEEQAARAAEIAAQQAAAEAAERTEEDARQARLASKTVGMTKQITALVRSYYGIDTVPLIPNTPLCREDGYCDFNVGVFRVQVYGAGLATVEPTNQASLTDYIELCAVTFAAISGSDTNYAGEVVGLIYGAALASGSAERDVGGVEIKFSPSLGGAMGCRLFKY